MVNVSESVFKDRQQYQAKVIVTPELKQQRESEDGVGLNLRGQKHSSVDSRHLIRYYFLSGTWKPRISPAFVGQPDARRAYGSADLGGRKKQMPLCNGLDTRLMSRCESTPTSDWSFIAREFAELFLTRESK